MSSISSPSTQPHPRDLAIAGRELRERALEVVARLDVSVLVRRVEDVLGDVLVELDEDRAPALVEPLRRPLDHLVDDDAVGDGVAPAALELRQEPQRHGLRAVERVVLRAAADAAAQDDRLVVALQEHVELLGGEESGVLGVSRIVHRGDSQVGHGLILRGFVGRLADLTWHWHPGQVDEEQGIYRGEVTEIMWKLADIEVLVKRILAYIEGDDDEWEEEEEEEDHPPDA